MSALKALFGFVVMITCGLPVLAGDTAPAGAPAEPAKAPAAVTSTTPMPMPVVQPKFEEYVSTMLIVGKWGEKPGEYQYRIWEGDYDWPRQFVVTDEEHIYILDQINNRVQHYNAEGKLLEMIPIESYKLASKKEIAKNNGLDYSTVRVNWFGYVHGKIYAVCVKRQGDLRTEYLVELQRGRFKLVTLAKELVSVNKEIASQDEKIRVILKDDKKMQIKKALANSGVADEVMYDGLSVNELFSDKGGNRWIRSNAVIRKYSSDGKLLFEMPWKYETVAVSKSGHLYLLDLYPIKQLGAHSAAFEDDHEGICVRKFTLKK